MKKSIVISALENCEDSVLMNIMNDCTGPGEQVYEMSQLDEVFNEMSPSDIIGSLDFGSFDTLDNYFEWDGNGYVHSFNSVDESEYYDLDTLADYIMENGDDYGLFDNDSLKDEFINQYFSEGNANLAQQLVSLYEEENSEIEWSTENWDEVYDNIKSFILSPFTEEDNSTILN